MQETYVPGVCNIGPAEIRQRARGGYTALAVTVVLEVFFLVVKTPPYLRLLVFLPASAAAIGFIQARMHFCAGFGMKGLFNVVSDLGKTDTVEQAEFRAKDRQKAIQIIVYSLLVGLVVAAITAAA